jgi:repressor LexA
MRPLTTKQAEILAFLRLTLEQEQRTPSYREICDHFGFVSLNAVTGHLIALEKKGYISRGDKGDSRSLKLLRVVVRVEDAP